MVKRHIGIGIALLFCTVGYGQSTDSLTKKLDSLSRRPDSARAGNVIESKTYTPKTAINVPTYFILLGNDFKQQFTAPFHFSRRDWKRTGAFALALGALSFADRPLQRVGLRLRNSSSRFRDISGFVTDFGADYEVYTLLGLATYGFVFKHQKVKTTTLLATQAYLTSLVVESTLKTLTGRQRPSYIEPGRTDPRPLFHGPFYKGGPSRDRGVNSGFPSGHTTIAFAAATVYAMEYRNIRAIPLIAYGAATLIGLSRISENRHWITDVVAGAALGIASGRQVVNNYHRYAGIKAPEKKRGGVRLSLLSGAGGLQPGIVYTFRE
ncbi:MAG TPA: phosphatase PAP2 family protein [Hymenobacter sp.]